MFKLGKSKKFYATAGQIKTKMRFGKQSGEEGSVPGTPVIRMPLADGVMGEANMDGTIYISDKLEPGSYEEINAEKDKPKKRFKSFRQGKFERKDINGVDSILVDGEWKEAGSHDFPWEEEANNGNDHGNI